MILFLGLLLSLTRPAGLPVSDQAAACRSYAAQADRGGRASRDPVRAYAAARAALAEGCPRAERRLARLRRRITIDQRLAALELTIAMIAPAPLPTPPAPLPAARSAAIADEAPALPSPRVIHVAQTMVSAGGADAPPAGWQVQLGAFRIAGNAQAQWARLGAQVAALRAMTPLYARHGGMVRLRLGALGPDQAASLCHSIAAAGSACFAIGPDRHDTPLRMAAAQRSEPAATIVARS